MARYHYLTFSLKFYINNKMANLKKHTKYLKITEKKPMRPKDKKLKLDKKASGDNYSSEEEINSKNKLKNTSSSLNIKEIYESACYSEPIFIIDQTKKKILKFDEETENQNTSEYTEMITPQSIKKKNSNTFTEITKLSDTEFDKNEQFSSVEDSWLQYEKSSLTSLSSEFKNELTFNSFSDSDESYFGSNMPTKINKKVRFKKVKFNLDNLINIL